MKQERLKLLNDDLINKTNILIVQDLDGVCIPLVKNPLTRTIDSDYVNSVHLLGNEFAVLTNGEHEGKRGVNRIIEKLYEDKSYAVNNGLYFPGLAAGGIQLQDRFGKVSTPGVSSREKSFLSNLAPKMISRMEEGLEKILVEFNKEDIHFLARESVLDNDLSPTINLNGIFLVIKDNFKLQQSVQLMLEDIMENFIIESINAGLDGSFYLHKAPNLGKNENKELIKLAAPHDVGTTDIQFMLSGARKEAGVLVLLNNYIESTTGRRPFGVDFTARNAPNSLDELITLCVNSIGRDEMPLLVGVGDTVTSCLSSDGKSWLRGGSDRQFLTLIQMIGETYKLRNKVLLVDSSGGEVDRPSMSTVDLVGISDSQDTLKFDMIFEDGPKGYISWFSDFALKRSYTSLN